MKKIIIILAIISFFPAISFAADITLEITIPDAWVAVATSAINSKFPGRTEAGMTQKQWAEHQVRLWLRHIVAEYKSRIDSETALQTQGYTTTADGDVPIAIAGE